MTPTRSIDRARAAWLAGDSAAWTRYTACLRDLPAPGRPAQDRADRERTARRARRRGRVARA